MDAVSNQKRKHKAKHRGADQSTLTKEMYTVFFAPEAFSGSVFTVTVPEGACWCVMGCWDVFVCVEKRGVPQG